MCEIRDSKTNIRSSNGIRNMKLIKLSLAAAALGVSVIGLTASSLGAQTTQTVPIDAWALRTVVNNVQVSPDGKHLLVQKLDSREGEYLLQIFKTDDLSTPLRTLAADPMEIISASWVSDNFIFGGAWQVLRKSVKGPEQDVRERAGFSYNLEKNKFSKVDDNFGIVNTLPNEPNTLLVETGKPVGEGSGVDPFAIARPRAYYKYNLLSGSKSLITKGTNKFPNMTFDSKGNPRVRTAIDRATYELSLDFRMPGETAWKRSTATFDQDEHEHLYKSLGGPWGVVGFDPDRPEIAYALDSRDGDKAALWEYNVQTDEYVRKLFEDKDADVLGIQTHSLPGNDKMVAAVYSGAKRERHWFDEEEKALHEALEKQIPFGHYIRISSRSRDGNIMVVQNTGPRDPGTFWLVKNGQLAKLGSRNPLINPEQLSDVEYIRYPARDGLTIPAYVTKPKGEGPFPLVVLPHGGPHVNEVIMYDEWGQLLANNGYMVLQPQYRMSVGWGKKHFDAGYGEHGLAMQDDKDDGALYLIDQGLVDPDRVAMFGWSYGGYAALVATSREDNIYQCAIAGAAVADPAKSYRQRSRGGSGPKAIDDWAQRRGMIGINPIKEVSKANIPLLMVHGDVDARVLYFHYKDYKKAMEAAGKNSQAQYLTLKGADHFSNTLMFNHQKAFYTKMLDFLANDCGPGGL